MNIKRVLYFLLVSTAIIIGLYPFLVLSSGASFDLLKIKEKVVLDNVLWSIGFYTHVTFGGIALLIGWTQFSKKLRVRNIKVHQLIGKIYIFTALLSAFSSIYISFFSTGGPLAAIGFLSMSIIWFYTTVKAFLSIRAKNILEHERMMIYSYATCFAGVTFRIWNPLFIFLFDNFLAAYCFTAWWSWVPNLFIAYLLNNRKSKAVYQT